MHNGGGVIPFQGDAVFAWFAGAMLRAVDVRVLVLNMHIDVHWIAVVAEPLDDASRRSRYIRQTFPG